MSLSILTACILAHLNNIAEPGTFNTHLNYLLKKNNLPEFLADDHPPSHKIFNVASLTRSVTPSQELLNEQMEDDDILITTEIVETEKKPPTTTTTTTTGTKPKEQRKEKQQQQQISHIPAKDLGLVVYTPQTKPFPGYLTYEHLKEFILKDKYKITYTANKSITDIINNNQI